MKTIKFTEEMYKTIREATESVKGTTEYNRYDMEGYCLKSNGKSWYFVGWGRPFFTNGVIKFTTFGTFIYNNNGDERYRITEAVYDLLKLEEY